jgi:hypothetical protein
MDPITIALGLAQFAPTLLRFFGVGEKNAKVAEKVVEVAQAITGRQSPQEALEAIQADARLQLDFQNKILDREQELTRLYYTDVADARKRDAEFVKNGKVNARANWLAGLAILVVIGICVAVWASPNIPEYQKGIATLVLGRFLGYIDQVFNFEFGTTRSSKQKDATIEALTK